MTKKAEKITNAYRERLYFNGRYFIDFKQGESDCKYKNVHDALLPIYDDYLKFIAEANICELISNEEYMELFNNRGKLFDGVLASLQEYHLAKK